MRNTKGYKVDNFELYTVVRKSKEVAEIHDQNLNEIQTLTKLIESQNKMLLSTEDWKTLVHRTSKLLNILILIQGNN